MNHSVTLLMSEFVTHDVKRLLVSRPPGFTFEPGQGVELAINRPQWQDEGRPFTPTGLVDDKVLQPVDGIDDVPAFAEVVKTPAGDRQDASGEGHRG